MENIDFTLGDLAEISEKTTANPQIQKERFNKLKILIYDVTGNASVMRMRKTAVVCKHLLASNELGRAFFFDVFHYMSYVTHAETARADHRYRELVEFIADDLASADVNAITFKHIFSMPEFQAIVEEYLKQRTSPLEAKIAFLSLGKRSSEILDEYEAVA